MRVKITISVYGEQTSFDASLTTSDSYDPNEKGLVVSDLIWTSYANSDDKIGRDIRDLTAQMLSDRWERIGKEVIK